MSESLEGLGFSHTFKSAMENAGWGHLEAGRVVEAHQDHYIVRSEHGSCQAEISGRLRHTLTERSEFPTVGDWVAVALLDGEKAIIHHILPRQTALYRRSASQKSVRQIIGANIDVALVVQAVEHDFNLNRLDRYLAATHGGGIRPVVVLSKCDLLQLEAVEGLEREVLNRHPGLKIIRTSSLTMAGLASLREFLQAGLTYCVLGSSGVGKSTLINALMGEDIMATQSISDWNQRGKHTTTHRALFAVPSGGILIDTPGMRELGLTDGEEGIQQTFSDITALAENCRFSDCRHQDEPGCAILAALESGALDPKKLENYEKIRREAAHFSASAAEKRKLARSTGKLHKRILNEKNRHRFQAD